MSDDPFSFPHLLQKFRLERGWSKSDLAKRARFDPSTITRFEQGSREPERETVLVLVDAMALSLVDRDSLLASAGYRSESWDEPLILDLIRVLHNPALGPEDSDEVRTLIRFAIRYGEKAVQAASLEQPRTLSIEANTRSR